jgi:acyl-coenzyme A synthetase/AMP-(fatty) acid ligase
LRLTAASEAVLFRRNILLMTPATLALITHQSPDAVLAYRAGQPLTAARFLADVAALGARMPPGHLVANACSDRYHFAVGLAAAMVAGRCCVLPAALTAENGRQLAALSDDIFCLSDQPVSMLGLPMVSVINDAPVPTVEFSVPQIEREREVVRVFTSGSTGQPQWHAKTWGALVDGVQSGARLLGLSATRAAVVMATVPAQHMFGLESTIILPWQTAGALCAERPFFPADICSQLAAVPAPRLLVSTPLHLRALMQSELPLPQLEWLLSSTAPLSQGLARQLEAASQVPLMEIYGSTETGQIAQRRTAQSIEWTLYPEIRLAPDASGTRVLGARIAANQRLNDHVQLLSEHRFELLGRNEDLINIAGKRNSLAWLDQQLLSIPGVQDAAFYMPEHEIVDGVTRLMAFVVAPGVNPEQLSRALRLLMDPVFLPRPLFHIDKLPRTASGKLPCAALATLALSCLKGETS